MDVAAPFEHVVGYVPRLAAGLLVVGFVAIQWMPQPLGGWLLRRTKLKPAVVSVSLSMVVANAAKGTTSDIIAGLFLALDADLDIGFRVKAGGVEGVIEKIDLRKIRLRDDAGNLHVIPNRLVEGATWVVLSRDSEKQT